MTAGQMSPLAGGRHGSPVLSPTGSLDRPSASLQRMYSMDLPTLPVGPTVVQHPPGMPMVLIQLFFSVHQNKIQATVEHTIKFYLKCPTYFMCSSIMVKCMEAFFFQFFGLNTVWLVEANFPHGTINHKSYWPDLGSDIYQYGISALIPQWSFCWETSCGVAKCWLFSQATSQI